MDMILGLFDHLNWLAVLVATVANFFLGWLWYSPMLFGNTWAKEIGMSEEEMKNPKGMGAMMFSAFIFSIVTAIALATIVQMPGMPIDRGALIGIVIAVFFIGPVKGKAYLFERKSTKLFLINLFHDIVIFGAMGTILAAWKK